MDTNKILIDYLTFTSKSISLEGMIEYLGLDNPIIIFQEKPGFYFYRNRYNFEGIDIMYNGMHDNMGICCQMSGQGCRAFETYGNGNFDEIFKDIAYSHKIFLDVKSSVSDFEQDMNITRIDVAYDDFDGLLDINRICDDIDHFVNCVSPLSYWKCEKSSEGSSAYIGSSSSPFRLRFYDKALERGYNDGRHWIRCEIQLRGSRACEFVCAEGSIGEKFVKVLNNYVRFIEPGNDTNKQRRKTAEWWLKFVEHIEKMSIYSKPGVEYNEFVLSDYVFGQAGNSIYTYIQCFGVDKFFDSLKKRGTYLNSKQLKLIEKYKGAVKNDTVTND